MRTLPFYQVDVFTDRAVRRQPAGGLPRGRGSHGGADAGDRQRDEPVGDHVRAAAGGRRRRAGAHLHARARAAVRRPPERGHRLRARPPRARGRPRAGHARRARARRRADRRRRLRRGRRPVSATVHQGPPVFDAPAPRDSVAAVLGLEVDDLHPELDPAPRRHRALLHDHPAAPQRTLARVSLDLTLLATSSARHAEVYPFAFTGEDEPWVEARGLFPLVGIPEDPATGSAAGPLAAYLARAGCWRRGRPAWCPGRAVGRPSRLTVVGPGSRAHRRRAGRRRGAPRPPGRLFLPD